MKVLTHDGVLLTLPDLLARENAFLRLDGQGTAAVGIVGDLDKSAVEQKAQEAAAIEGFYSTPQEITTDLRFISRALSDVAEGAEIRVEWRGSSVRLVVPPEARAARPPIRAQDRVVFNGRVSPKVMLNARGTVESVMRGRATIMLDAGDHRRIVEASGKDRPQSTKAPVEILDKLEGEQS